LAVPGGSSARHALALLRQTMPAVQADYIHIYDPSSAGASASGQMPDTPAAPGVSVGMIDGGVSDRHGAFRGAHITAANFAGTATAPATVHGTAIASLLVGQDRSFRGHLPGAHLFAADVYGGQADGGNAVAISRALDWMAANRVPVVNISLAGPHNILLAAAVHRFLAKGHVLVAAVGNEGPASQPRFPAAYHGVVAVTAVNAEHRLMLEANPMTSGFAAFGIDVPAARLPDGYAHYSGTSFAAPAVTAAFAHLLVRPDVEGANSALTALTQRSPRLVSAGDAQIYLIEPATAPPP
jgi:subtilisin family serine protease